MCKYNIAAYDRRTLPYRNRPERCSFSIYTDYFPILCGSREGASRARAAEGCILFYLTADGRMRHNNIYIKSERPDGQTEKARSENAGVEANRHPQPATRCGFRHAVQRKSILRSQGSSSGPLRDAAPTQRGGSLDCRCGFPVWRFTPHGVSGPGCFPAAGLSGLLPKHRGPKEGHKLSTEVIEYVRTLRVGVPGLTTVACVQAVQEKFGIAVHRRSLERALSGKKKPRNLP